MFPIRCIRGEADACADTRPAEAVVVVDVNASGVPLPVLADGVLEDVVRHRTRGGGKRPTRRDVALRYACTWEAAVCLDADTPAEARAAVLSRGHDVVVTSTPAAVVELLSLRLPPLSTGRNRVPVALAAVHRGLCGGGKGAGAQPPRRHLITTDTAAAEAWCASVARETHNVARLVEVRCAAPPSDAPHLPTPPVVLLHRTPPPVAVVLCAAGPGGAVDIAADVAGAAGYLEQLAATGQLQDLVLPLRGTCAEEACKEAAGVAATAALLGAASNDADAAGSGEPLPSWASPGDRALESPAVCVRGRVGFLRATGKVVFIGLIPYPATPAAAATPQVKIQVIAHPDTQRGLLRGAGGYPPLVPGDVVVVYGAAGVTQQRRASVFAARIVRLPGPSFAADPVAVLAELDGGAVAFAKPAGMTGQPFNEMKAKDHPTAAAAVQPLLPNTRRMNALYAPPAWASGVGLAVAAGGAADAPSASLSLTVLALCHAPCGQEGPAPTVLCRFPAVRCDLAAYELPVATAGDAAAARAWAARVGVVGAVTSGAHTALLKSYGVARPMLHVWRARWGCGGTACAPLPSDFARILATLPDAAPTDALAADTAVGLGLGHALLAGPERPPSTSAPPAKRPRPAPAPAEPPRPVEAPAAPEVPFPRTGEGLVVLADHGRLGAVAQAETALYLTNQAGGEDAAPVLEPVAPGVYRVAPHGTAGGGGAGCGGVAPTALRHALRVVAAGGFDDGEGVVRAAAAGRRGGYYTLAHDWQRAPAGHAATPFVQLSDVAAMTLWFQRHWGAPKEEDGGEAFVAVYLPRGFIVGRVASAAELIGAAAAPEDPAAARFCTAWEGKPFSFSGSMDPSVAVLLLNVAFLAGGAAEVVVDGCCGSGTLSAAAAAVFGCRVFASEVRAEFVANARQNLQHVGLAEDRVAVRQHDASTAYPAGFTAGRPAELVVCNPPWGVRFGAACEALPILTCLVRSFPHAKFLFVAPRHACEALLRDHPRLRELRSFPFGKAHVFLAQLADA